MNDVLGFVRKLQEHAFQRKEIKKSIESLQIPIKQHLTKIALFPYHQAANHWIKEIVVWLGKISEKQGKNKRLLKEKDYFHFLFEKPFTPLDLIEKGIELRIEEYEDLKPCMKDIRSKAVKIEKEAKKFLKEISKDLSEGTYSISKTKQLLKEYKNVFLEDCKSE